MPTNVPVPFSSPGFVELASSGYLIACFPVRQNTGQPTEARTLDMSAMYADKLDGENSEHAVQRWREAFENAAFEFLISPWNPHDEECPNTPCPPCEE